MLLQRLIFPSIDTAHHVSARLWDTQHTQYACYAARRMLSGIWLASLIGLTMLMPPPNHETRRLRARPDPLRLPHDGTYSITRQ
jgi:hypothetical protein